MSEWNLTPDDFLKLRDQTVLWLSDGEHCAVIIAGQRGDAAAEFRKIVGTTVTYRIHQALEQWGCPTPRRERVGLELLHAALQWSLARDAALQPTEGSA